MRRFVLIALLLTAGAPGRAEELPGGARTNGADNPPALPAGVPVILREVLEKYQNENGHWAYIETDMTRVKNSRGAVKSVKRTVVRHDPSQPYGEQRTLLERDNRPVTAQEAAKFREDQKRPHKPHKSLGDLAELEKATVVEETPEAVTFEVPLRKDDSSPVPPENIGVWLRVNKEQRVFEHAEVRLRAPFHMALVAKVSAVEIEVTFAQVDPQFAPTVVAMKGDMALTFLFMKFSSDHEATRTDFKRVTPYSDRFKVKLGPLKFLDF